MPIAISMLWALVAAILVLLTKWNALPQRRMGMAERFVDMTTIGDLAPPGYFKKNRNDMRHEPAQPQTKPSGPAPSPPPTGNSMKPIEGAFARLIDSHPKLAYALSEWFNSDTWGHFQINRANGKYLWNNLISDRE